MSAGRRPDPADGAAPQVPPGDRPVPHPRTARGSRRSSRRPAPEAPDRTADGDSARPRGAREEKEAGGAAPPGTEARGGALPLDRRWGSALCVGFRPSAVPRLPRFCSPVTPGSDLPSPPGPPETGTLCRRRGDDGSDPGSGGRRAGPGAGGGGTAPEARLRAVLRQRPGAVPVPRPRGPEPAGTGGTVPGTAPPPRPVPRCRPDREGSEAGRAVCREEHADRALPTGGGKVRLQGLSAPGGGGRAPCSPRRCAAGRPGRPCRPGPPARGWGRSGTAGRRAWRPWR